MKQKNLTISAIIVVIAIIAVIIIAAYQTKFFSEARTDADIIKCAINVVPDSGLAGTPITINISNLSGLPADKGIDICWYKGRYSSNSDFFGSSNYCFTTFTTTQGSNEYSTSTNIPPNAQILDPNGTFQYYIVVSDSREEGETGKKQLKLSCRTPFTIAEQTPELPAPAETTEISPTEIETTTASTTPSPTETPPAPSSPTAPETSQSVSTTTVPTASPTPTTAAPSVIAPLPVITAPAPAATSAEPAYTAPPVFTASPTPTPDTTAIPIIVTDDDTGSIIETDKDEISADGEDKVVITVTLKDESGQTSNETPQIEISGANNTVSEVKKEKDGKYSVALSSTSPEEKTVKIKAGDRKLPEIKIAARDTGIDLEKIAKEQPLSYTPYYQSWWFWTLIMLGIALILVLSLSYRHKLHSEEY